MSGKFQLLVRIKYQRKLQTVRIVEVKGENGLKEAFGIFLHIMYFTRHSREVNRSRRSSVPGDQLQFQANVTGSRIDLTDMF